jgi:hypothetical protein
MVGVGAHLVPFANGRLEPMMLRVVSGSPSATFSLPNIFAIVAVRLPPSLTPPPRRISVGYNVNYTVQTSDLNYSGVSTHLDFIAQKSGIVAASSSGSTHDAYPRATEPDIIMGALLKVDDANQVAEDLLALFGSRLRLYDITVPADIAEGIEIGGVVEIRYPIDDLDAGKLGRVVRRNLVAGDVVATLRVLI